MQYVLAIRAPAKPNAARRRTCGTLLLLGGAAWLAGHANAAAAAPAPEVAPATLAAGGVTFVPITFRQVSGTRPFIGVLMNGKPFQMMLHANAGFYVMTTHANAAAIGLANLGKAADFGITSAGHASALGLARATLATLSVGGVAVRDVPLSVFEAPQEPAMDGMLGIGWLRAQRVIVDYDAYRVGLPASVADASRQDARLVGRGYRAHKMQWDAANARYYLMGSINGVAARLVVSTVADNAVDSGFAHAAGLALGPVIDQNGGPQGALVDTFLLKRQVRIIVDGQATAPSQPRAWDFYAYDSAPRPAPSDLDAYLGAQFMLANQAVIDFGTETLLLAPQAAE